MENDSFDLEIKNYLNKMEIIDCFMFITFLYFVSVKSLFIEILLKT
jgi:hypothetical protein